MKRVRCVCRVCEVCAGLQGGSAGPLLDSGRDKPGGDAGPRRRPVRRHGRPGGARPRLHDPRLSGQLLFKYFSSFFFTLNQHFGVLLCI